MKNAKNHHDASTGRRLLGWMLVATAMLLQTTRTSAADRGLRVGSRPRNSTYPEDETDTNNNTTSNNETTVDLDGTVSVRIYGLEEGHGRVCLLLMVRILSWSRLLSLLSLS